MDMGAILHLGGFFGAKASRLRDVISGVPRKIRGIILVVITAVIVIFQNFAGRNLINNMYAEYFYDAPLTILWLVALFSWAIQKPLSPKARRIIHFVSPLTRAAMIRQGMWDKYYCSFAGLKSDDIRMSPFIDPAYC